MNLPSTRSFGPEEVSDAMAMIELCIDLNNQDDRMAPHARAIYQPIAARSTDLWTKVGDSRELFAAATNLSDPADRQDPGKNGFPPFNSAWTLWRKKSVPAGGAPKYALAFRGTVFANKSSDLEDLLAALIPASCGIRTLHVPDRPCLPLTFATMPRAQVHEGFAYAVLSQLFDAKFGALPVIMKSVEPGSTLLITGHSQGAAVGTLAHAFFHYAAQDDLCGLRAKALNLRSYLFAQPKPGNSQFALDFAEITGAGAHATIYTNTLDPVPKVPPTHTFLSDATEDMRGHHPWLTFLQGVESAWNHVRTTLTALTEKKLAQQIEAMQRQGHNSLYAGEELRAKCVAAPSSLASQGYFPAGNIVPLRGKIDGTEYYHNAADGADDVVMQHHATTYRRLLEDLYGYPPSTESKA